MALEYKEKALPAPRSYAGSQRTRFQKRFIPIAVVALICVYFFSQNFHFSLNNRYKFSSSPLPIYLPSSATGRYSIQATTFPRESRPAKAVRLTRQRKIKEEFLHAWKGYTKNAWMHDEVMPLSGGQKDTFVGWAATLVDSLDTLYIMGLKEEFEEALESLKQIDFSKPNAERVPVFETTIRYLGGLLGAWDISDHQYPILLEKAKQLGDLLFRAFNTESGIPTPYYWWEKQLPIGDKIPGENGVLVAQIASLSLEFIRLSQVTGDRKYENAIQRITDQLESTQNTTTLPGMWPSQANCMGPNLTFSSRTFTLGAFADSAFEYLPKTHLILPKSSSGEQYKRMYGNALSTIKKHIIFRPNLPGDPDILFSGTVDVNTGQPLLDTQVQHLGCFVGGMIGLGSRINQSPAEMETAIKLTQGCIWAYENTPSGIMPEIFHVNPCTNFSSCTWSGEDRGNGFSRIDDPSYQLRPEAIESIFIMYRLTGDRVWQEKGWKMFRAIVKHTHTNIANSRIKNVMDLKPEKEDGMESYWLAETLKYFYLLFAEPGLVSLDEFVLNTEAHPLRQAGGGAV
ncbi:glycoside hydrolase family 47 protein [Sclerotinia borealis F-4128]|uniref:alpha-1,2-Mannosidase n=1 Tax=Sclerotinia borealis (strain F-4128) TaxID=1432307 RepID=W9CUC7_SCLBF|nr:glycoside hydrolase family 47 protein [Sclerotinia borealis F-4128]